MKPLYSLAVLALGLAPVTALAQASRPVVNKDATPISVGIAPRQTGSYAAGLRALSVLDGRRDRALEGLIWYPAEATELTSLDFGSKVWVGSQVIRGAPAAEGPFPIIVVSHGMFGNARNQAWFAASMARRGYVVAAVDHPGTSTWSRDPDQRRALWERSRDITRLIDFALSPGAIPAQVDPDRVFMAGHSLGGFTALTLAGARFDATGLERFCKANVGEMVCGIFDDWDIAERPEDRDQMGADLSDSRIRAFAVFDLGGTQSFSEESLGRLHRPLLVFGAPIMNSGLTLDIESRALVKALPSGRFRYVEPATLTHFDFFNLCKPGGYDILAREEPGDEIICEDGGAHRAAMHDKILDEVTAFFAKSVQ
ncbi:alpha/beta hydrolase family protein [Antarctobacter heliothermus]|uniref:Predicted dienelactone hydrolase n=1 Tax=Antarctobacter heliothermus TaxID=74033 RepID=A0A239H9G7_9RHOB|nr:alpha/beta fold hydrolase [Antarctobacter heliothermus]SNS77463.1 Predicted dienelactone hydrolase [Antarctobacter heliothermus]